MNFRHLSFVCIVVNRTVDYRDTRLLILRTLVQFYVLSRSPEKVRHDDVTPAAGLGMQSITAESAPFCYGLSFADGAVRWIR